MTAEKTDSSFDTPGGWFIAKNTSSDAIPPFGVCALDFDADEGMATVSTPGDNEITVAFNGRSAINPGARGYVHRTFPCAAAVEKSATSGTTIQRGARLGTASGRFTLQPGKSGFKATSDDIDGVGVVNVVADFRQGGDEETDGEMALGVDSSLIGAGNGKWIWFPFDYNDLVAAGGATTTAQLTLINTSNPFVIGYWGLVVLEAFNNAGDTGSVAISRPGSWETYTVGATSLTSPIRLGEMVGTYGSTFESIYIIGEDWRHPSDPAAPDNEVVCGFSSTVNMNTLTKGRAIIYLWVTAPFTSYPA